MAEWGSFHRLPYEEKSLIEQEIFPHSSYEKSSTECEIVHHLTFEEKSLTERKFVQSHREKRDQMGDFSSLDIQG